MGRSILNPHFENRFMDLSFFKFPVQILHEHRARAAPATLWRHIQRDDMRAGPALDPGQNKACNPPSLFTNPDDAVGVVYIKKKFLSRECNI